MQMDNIFGFVDDLRGKINEEQESMNHHKVNIIVAGKTGTGKSTLINACFRKELAKTGIGRPVTGKTQVIEDADLPLRIYDTVGLELTESTKKSTIEDLHELIEERKGTENEIHCVWYCVLVASSRFEQAEEDLVSEITNLNVPVILVLTQANAQERAKKFKEEIIKSQTKAKKIQMVLAVDDEDFGVKAYGKDELIYATSEFISDDNLKRSWINASSSLPLKRDVSVKLIYKACASAAGAAIIPIPVADSVVLTGIQIGMMAKINALYGISMTKSQMFSLAGALLGVVGTNFAGRAIFTGLLKMIPGAGSIVGGVIGAGTAVILTYALGYTYIYIMEAVYKNTISLENIDMNFIGQIMKTYVANATDYMKQATISGNFDEDAFERISREREQYHNHMTLDSNDSMEMFVQDMSYDSENKKENVNKNGILGGIFNLFSKGK